jgi:hypothetical protein
MADTGYKSPGTMANDSSFGTTDWSDVDKAKASDNDYATNTLAMGIFPFDERARIVKSDGNIGSTEKATQTNITTTDTYYIYGGSSDLWGETWTAEDINDSDFGFVISYLKGDHPMDGYIFTKYIKATNFGFDIPTDSTIDGIIAEVESSYSGVTKLINVDHIRIKVYYTEPTSDTSKFFQLF